jgi:hypothetical protein
VRDAATASRLQLLRLDRERRVAKDFGFGLVAAPRSLLYRSRPASGLGRCWCGCHCGRRGHDRLRWRHGLRCGCHWLKPGWRWRSTLGDLLLRRSGCRLCIRRALDRRNNVPTAGRGGERERRRRRRCGIEISTQIRRRLRRRIARRNSSDGGQRQSGYPCRAFCLHRILHRIID